MGIVAMMIRREIIQRINNKMILDFFRKSILLLKLPFLALSSLIFSTIYSHLLSKFADKSARKSPIFPTKANRERCLLDDTYAPIPEIFENFKSILGLRAVLYTIEFINDGEAHLAIETLISGMDVNNIYISPKIFQSFMDWKLDGYYLGAVYRLNTREEYILNGLNKFIIRLFIPKMAKNLIVDKINEGDLHSVYNSIIECIIQHEALLLSDDYCDLVRLGLIIEGVDPASCLKINHLVASHIENDPVYYEKILQVIKDLGENISENHRLQLLEYLKHNELEEIVDSICCIIEKGKFCITQQTFDLLSEIARKFACEDYVGHLIMHVENHELCGRNYWRRLSR